VSERGRKDAGSLDLPCAHTLACTHLGVESLLCSDTAKLLNKNEPWDVVVLRVLFFVVLRVLFFVGQLSSCPFTFAMSSLSPSFVSLITTKR